jgi:hypothetical protein
MPFLSLLGKNRLAIHVLLYIYMELTFVLRMIYQFLNLSYEKPFDDSHAGGCVYYHRLLFT